MRRLREYTEAVKSRLQLARELSDGEAKAIAKIQTEVRGLEGLIANADLNVVEPLLKEADASADTLAMAHGTADHVLTAEELAIGDLEKKHKLKLVPQTRL